MKHHAQTVIMQSGAAPNGLKGEPRMVRVTTRNIRDSHSSAPVVQEEVQYLPNGKISERIVYRNDGSVSYRWSYDYENGVTRTRTLDNQGNLLTTNVERTNGDTREDILLNARGAMLERTVTKQNPIAKTTESTTTDASGVRTAYWIVHYDRNSEISHGEALIGDDGWRFDVRTESGVTTFEIKQLDGTVLMEKELTNQPDPNVVTSQTYSPGEYIGDFSSPEDVIEVDFKGNWTRKLRKPGNNDAESVLLERVITYYPDKH